MPQNIYIYNPRVPVPKNVRHVEIPEEVTVIKENAFRNCHDLQSVTIPDSVTKIGNSAFYGCSDLQSVTIPDGIIKIEGYAFCECSALQSVRIPDSVTAIGYSAFNDCSGLRSVTIPDGVTKIAGYAFHKCSALQSVRIPDSVTAIGYSAFNGCSGLRSVTIPDGVTEILPCAFKDCSALQSISIPDGITKINEYSFRNCSGLRSVTLPDCVTEIGDGAFRNCYELQSVNIPDGVTKIGNSAFFGCSALQSVTIPDSVTEIEDFAFCRCSGLQSVTIPDSVTKIGDYAFSRCSGLRSITIPDSATEIGCSVFRKCSGLESVTISDSVTKIDDYAFDGCSALRTVTIPDSVTEIGNYSFLECSALQSLMYKGVNIAPFINIDGYGVNTYDVIKVLVEHHIPLSEHTVKAGIDMAHRNRLSQWIDYYQVFGEMRLPSAIKFADKETKECLRRLFAAQKKTGRHVPKVLDKLAITACICGIPPERLAGTFDIEYTKKLLSEKIPIVPATVCRCYYNRNTCDMLIRKDKISVMAEAIGLYNRPGHPECYRHLMDFILAHPDTKIEDLQYAVDHAEEIPIKANTTLAQIRQHRTYMENLAEVTKIEAKYGAVVPEFRLADYPCRIDPISITYDGMTARVLDLSDEKDIALAARLGELTGCCQRLRHAGETAMMHGFLNPDAGFWVIEDKNGKVRAQAEIWKTKNGNLVFDNIEFANTDKEHLTDRADQLRGVIAAWATESGYRNIVMGCGFNELGTGSMEQAPIPELTLTPKEVFALQKGNDARVSFRNMDDVHRYMQTWKYDPNDFVYTDTGKKCVYIKKDDVVSDYLMQGYDRILAEKHPASGHETGKER